MLYKWKPEECTDNWSTQASADVSREQISLWV